MKRTMLGSTPAGACLAMVLLLTAGTVQAQRSNTRGLFLNAHLSGTSMGFDNDAFDTQSGGGGGVQIGYGVSRLVTLFLGIDGASMSNDDLDGSVTLAHVDLGVQLNVGRTRSAARPYGTLAVTYREESFDIRGDEQNATIDFSGGGLTLGGGLKYFLSPPVSLDVGVAVTFGTFTDVQSGGVRLENIVDINATSGRFMVGLSWFPSRR